MATTAAAIAEVIGSVPQFQEKLELLQRKLGAADLASALEKSLNIANYIADTIQDPNSKLLIEQGGNFTELTTIR